MDDKPFFEFDMLNFSDSAVNELKRFSKATFDPDELGDLARNLLYTKEIKRLMAEQLTNPSPEFVKFFASQVYAGKMMASVVEKFTEITKLSLKEFINERITDRLKSAIALPEEASETALDKDLDSSTDTVSTENTIITTEEELEGFYIVKAILREVVDVGRIQYKDTKSYFGINLDGKVTNTICRLRFSTKKSIGILNAAGEEAKKELSRLDEIYGVAGILKDRVSYLTQNKYVDESTQAEVL